MITEKTIIEMRFLVQCNLGGWVGLQFLVEGLKKDGCTNVQPVSCVWVFNRLEERIGIAIGFLHALFAFSGQ
jgi:hypothetical protein